MNVYYVMAIWIGMALLASFISIRVGISVALIEILVGAVFGNIPGIMEHVQQTDYTTLLAGVGSVLLTFLAGAEIDPVSLKRHWKASLSLGAVSFLLPLIGAFCFAKYLFGWNLHAAEIAGIALSTTSVAVVYAVMVETGLNREDIGKLILAACFVTDLGRSSRSAACSRTTGGCWWCSSSSPRWSSSSCLACCAGPWRTSATA